jgi:hypothetical protein
MLMVLEDAQWLDSVSLRVVTDLVAERKSRPLLLVLTSRTPDLPMKSTVGGRLSTWKMQPLSPVESSEVLADLLHRHGLAVDAPMAEWCLDVASGNPFFIHSLVLHYAATREVRAIPEALGALLRERLELISRNARHVFAATAVLARHSTLENIESVVGLARYDLLDALQSLAELGFVEYGGARVTATHALLSDLALAAMPEVVRRLLHRNAAQVLAEVAHVQTSAAALWDAAEHWLETGDGSKSADALRACARHALEIGQPGEAVRALRRASEVASIPADLAAVRDELLLAAEIAGAWTTVLEVLRAKKNAHPKAVAATDTNLERLELEALLRTSSDPAIVVARLVRYATNETLSPEERLRACTLLVVAAEVLLSEELARNAKSLARLCQSSTDVGTYRLEFEVIYNASFGNLDLASQAARQLVRVADGCANLAAACRLRLTSGCALIRAGLLDEGIEVLEAGYHTATKHRLTTIQYRAANYLAVVFLDARGVVEGRVWHERASTVSEQLERHDGVAEFFSNCALFAIAAGDLDSAKRWVDRATLEVPAAGVGGCGLHFRALALRIKQLAASYDCPSQELDELLGLHLRYREFAHHDEVMDALWHALDRKGRTSEADCLLVEYLSRHRRLRWPLAYGLAHLTQERGIDLESLADLRWLGGPSRRMPADGPSCSGADSPTLGTTPVPRGA